MNHQQFAVREAPSARGTKSLLAAMLVGVTLWTGALTYLL